MKKNEDTHCILISPKLLFDCKNKYKSFYVPWVYVYLKLEKCIIFDKKIRLSTQQLQKHYTINRKEICNYYGFDKGTLSRALAQLKAMGLLEINGKEHKLINDNDFYHYEKNDPEKDINKTDDDFPSFVQIYNNFYIDFTEMLKVTCDLTNSPGLLMRTVETFYYLITRNRHILLDTERLESNETVDSIRKYLHHDREDINKSLWCLNKIGYINIDDDGKIHTNYKYGKSSVKKRSKASKTKYSTEYEIKTTGSDDNEQMFPVPVQQPDQWDPDVMYTEDEFLEFSNDIDTIDHIQSKSKSDPELESHEVYIAQPVSDKERIKLIEVMSNGDNEKFERLIKEHNFSDKAVEDWRQENQSDVNIVVKSETVIKPEMDYAKAKEHLEYLFMEYQHDSKKFAKEVERRNIPIEKLDMWIEEKSVEFASENEEQ